MKRKKKTPRKKLIAYLDSLWSSLTKRAAEIKGELFCQWCGKSENLQSDHIINRHKHSTRWRLENCILLCAGCHLFRKKREPYAWAGIVLKKYGQDRLDFLEEMSRSTEKVDLEQVKRYLENAAIEMQEVVLGEKA